MSLTTSEDDQAIERAMESLKKVYKDVKKDAKKKPKKRLKRKVKKLVKDEETGKEVEIEVEEYVNAWNTCTCGLNHPPVPGFDAPKGNRCFYYWQIAERFPFVTLYRVLTTEHGFLKADEDGSGMIEVGELKKILKDAFGYVVTDRMVERTFNEMDKDKSGALDFEEVLTMVDHLVQRRTTQLPEKVSKEYSKICSIQ